MNFLYRNMNILSTFRDDIVGISLGVMSLEDIINMCVPHGISHAWEIGRTVIRATRKNLDPVKAVLKEERGSLVIISGKVSLNIINSWCMCHRLTVLGFSVCLYVSVGYHTSCYIPGLYFHISLYCVD